MQGLEPYKSQIIGRENDRSKLAERVKKKSRKSPKR